jgi:branched-chain amino acid transport system substrate-binding protein
MENVAHDLIQFLHEAGKDIGPPIKKIAIVCEDSVLGKTTVASLAKFSKENGFNVVESITYNAASTSDFTGIVSRLKRSGADALVGYNLTQDAIQLIRTCVELDFNPTAVGAAMGGAVGLSFSDALKSLSNGILVVQPYSNDLNLPGLEEFKVRYETRFREEADLSSVATANAAHVVIQALEKAASTDRGAIRNALEGVDLGLDGNILLPSGCKFKNGDNIRAVSVVTQLKDGAYRAVAPKEFASTKAVWPKPNWS